VRLCGQTFSAPDGSTLHLSASVGFVACDPASTVAQLMQRADEALYAVKAGGRNGVTQAAAL
jgi:GGDEF domain-containing protein